MRIMKTKFLTILFTILLMPTTWSQTKNFGTKVKIKNIPEVTTIDTLVTASPTGILNSVKYTSLFTKMLADLQANGSLGGSAINSINDINDVTLTNPSGNQALMYNGSVWVNSDITIPASSVSGFATAVRDLVPVVNNVNSTSTTSALSANMGNYISARVDDFENDISLLQSKVDSRDANTNNIVDNSEKLNNQSASYYLDYNNLTNKPVINTSTNYKGSFETLTAMSADLPNWQTSDFGFLVDKRWLVFKNAANQNVIRKFAPTDFPDTSGMYHWDGTSWINKYIPGLVDNLTSISTNEALTANQGKILNDRVTENENNVLAFFNGLNSKVDNNPQDGNLYVRYNNTWANATASFVQSPSFVQTTVTAISLINKGGTFYTANNTATTFTVQNTNVYGGIAYVRIDSSGMTAYPTITGATLITSPDFVAGTHRMTVFNEAGTIKYFFTKE